ncbi:MAG: dephospho-CoA kinase [Bacteroidaceae bacterium]|nr:dephospho-CoA kinase [Bacteroidaceae bacterium]
MKIGITGGIGSGKTYICQRLINMGFPVFNCDEAAKRLMCEVSTLQERLSQLIGPNAYTEQGELNKRVIADYLFQSESHAAAVNAIVHPAVKADFIQWSKQQVSPYCFMESAILFESGFQQIVDKTVLVYADEQTRIQRVVMRDGIPPQLVYDRMALQMSADQAQELADYTLYNHADSDIETEIQKFMQWLSDVKNQQTAY